VRTLIRWMHQYVTNRNIIRDRDWIISLTFWISLSLSEIAKHTHRPQGVNYHGYVLKYLSLLHLNRQA